MPDYSLCKVYKIISNQTDKVYIGSTCQKYLSSRLAQHKKDYKKYLNDNKHYVSSFKILKYDDCKIVLIQSYTYCKNNMEKIMFEQDWIDCYDCVNGRKAYTSLEQKKEYNNEYNKINKEQIRERTSQKVLCECGSKLSQGHLSRHKKTSQKHQNYLNNLS
jgi:hypothetical protein